MLRYLVIVSFLMLSKSLFSQPLFSIPFSVKGDRIFLDISINGEKCNFLFDTGAFICSIDSSVNADKKLNIRPGSGAVDVKTGCFSLKSSLGVLDHRKYGGNMYDGIIGIRFFDGYLVAIDYDDRKLRLYSKSDTIVREFQKLPTTHHKNNMAIFGLFSTQVTIYLSETDSINGIFLIDTGSSRNITLFEKFYSILKETNLNHLYIEYANTSHHGFNQSVYYKVPMLRFDSYAVDSLVVDCSYGKNGDISRFADGIVGAAFLKNFNLLIDYAGSSVYIKQKEQKKAFSHEYISDGIGLKYQSDCKCVTVSSLIKDNRNDVKLGDVVLKINGEEPDEDSILNLSKDVGRKNKYTIKRGRKVFEVTAEVERML